MEGTTSPGHGGQIRHTRCITQRMPGDDHTQRIGGLDFLVAYFSFLSLCFFESPGAGDSA